MNFFTGNNCIKHTSIPQNSIFLITCSSTNSILTRIMECQVFLIIKIDENSIYMKIDEKILYLLKEIWAI